MSALYDAIDDFAGRMGDGRITWTQRGSIKVWIGGPAPDPTPPRNRQERLTDSLGDIYPAHEAAAMHELWTFGIRSPSVMAGHRQHMRAREVAA